MYSGVIFFTLIPLISQISCTPLISPIPADGGRHKTGHYTETTDTRSSGNSVYRIRE
jgi:hypothetical protein